MRVFSILVVFSLFGFLTANAAQIPSETNGGKGMPTADQDYNKAGCPPSSARMFMDFNNVKALVEAGGSLWQDRQNTVASYEVPKGGGNHVLYSGSIWMGGKDVNGQLKLAAIKFRQGNDFWTGPLSQTVGSGDYDPSQPVGDDAIRDFGAATIDADVCVQYDRFFTIKKADVINFTLAYECYLNPECDDEFPISNEGLQVIYNWPAHGDVSKGQDFYLAPFYDYPDESGSGDGIYDPLQGDIPWFDDILNRDDVLCGFDRRVTLFGDITSWWVFNDKGNIHTETGADPIGMEIHAQAFSFATNDEVNQMTFYNYEMINRSTQTLYNTYFSQYADPDVGFSEDDYVGCDVSRGLGIAYNGVNNDPGQSGAPGYGDNVPAIGIDFFEGPYQDADTLDNPGPYYDSLGNYVVPTVAEAIAGKGIVYAGIGIGYSDGIIDNERFGMRRFNYYDRQDKAILPGVTDDPNTAGNYYNYMIGKWKDNSPFVFGGKAHPSTAGATSVEALYCFPGDSDPYHWGTQGQDMGWDWTEINIDGSGSSNTPGDRRFLQTAGPFTLRPGAINNLTVGVVYGRSSSGNAAASVDVVKKNDTKAQALFDNCFEIMDPPTAPVLSIVELENELILMLDNPFGNNVNESYAKEDKINIPWQEGDTVEIDRFYRFEGYQIFQMKDVSNDVSDIYDPEKAILVAQCDIENDVKGQMLNYVFDEHLNTTIPQLMVTNTNRGIKHSFKITEDAFSNTTLVNHKTYYYIAIAYAYNNFKEYDPTDPTLLDGQKIPYISSRLAADGGSIKSVAGIPHSPAPSKLGTIPGLPYGSSPEITTLDGTGNGGRAIDLTEESEDFIVRHGSIDTPTYKEGRGPVDVKVIDPLNLVDGYFLLSFTENTPNKMDSATWVLRRYESKGGELLGTVMADRPISELNEQLIPQWGISVTAYLERYSCIDDEDLNCSENVRIAKPIETTIVFADKTKQWLTGVKDIDSYDPQNWIAAGEYNPTSQEDQPEAGVFNPTCYRDYIGLDPNKVFSKMLDGTVTLGQLVRINSCGFSPIGIPNGISNINSSSLNSFRQNQMPSVYQPSIDIVFTSDKSKWTRCPVLELGSDANLNINGAEPGLLRQSPSVDKEGRMLGMAGYNASEADPNGTTPIGMGWFPGYAIDVETGHRLNMAFGENSFLAGQNGGDMKWNPTSELYGANDQPMLGGQHIVYVFRQRGVTPSFIGDFPYYDEGEFVHELLTIAGDVLENTLNRRKAFSDFYSAISWVMNPLLVSGEELLSTDARVKVRINKMYKKFEMTGTFDNMPTYEWNMDKFKTITNDQETLASALDMINVVPNPYYGFSEYERGRLDTRIKITNLPDRCKIKIFNTSGKLIRAFDKDNPITSIDWDLTNSENIPVAGGVYLIHVQVDDIEGKNGGHRVLKFFGGLRAPDLENL